MTQPTLILGTAQLTTNYGVTRESRDTPSSGDAASLLVHAAELGITTLDTAPAYGEAEAVIGACDSPFRLHTKIKAGADEVHSLTDSLRRLRADSVDIVYVHDIDAFESAPGAVIERMRRCLDHGADRIGVSVYTASQLRLATGQPGVSAVQFPLNILDRRFVGDPLAEAKAAGFVCLARSVFLQGVLLESTDRLPPKVRHLSPHVDAFTKASESLGVSRAVAALAWVASQPGVDGVVAGAGSRSELEELVESWNVALALSATCVDELTSLVPEADGVDPRRWR
jgi:aryl-alcohol dehydrogenase-like predicted oxidoreductase